MRNIRQNLVLAFVYNVLCIPLAAARFIRLLTCSQPDRRGSGDELKFGRDNEFVRLRFLHCEPVFVRTRG